MYIEQKLDKILTLLEQLTGAPATTEEDVPAPKKAKAKKGSKAAAASEHTQEDIRELAVQVGAEVDDGRKKVISLLQRFGCGKLTDLDAEQYDEFYVQLKAVLDDGVDPADAEEQDEEPVTPAGKARKAKGKVKPPADEDDDEEDDDEEEEEEEEEPAPKRRSNGKTTTPAKATKGKVKPPADEDDDEEDDEEEEEEEEPAPKRRRK